MNRRESILATITLIALLLTTAWSYTELSSQRDGAQSAELSTATCRALATTIHSPRPLSSLIPHPSSFSSTLSTAATEADIPATSITSIDPQPTRPIEGSEYEKHPIRLTLHDLTLQQLVTFLHALPCPAEDLHLSATSDTTNTWSADMTVTFVTSTSTISVSE